MICDGLLRVCSAMYFKDVKLEFSLMIGTLYYPNLLTNDVKICYDFFLKMTDF